MRAAHSSSNPFTSRGPLSSGHFPHARIALPLLIPAVLAILIGVALPRNACAQGGGQQAVPKDGYFLVMAPFYNGEYKTALKGFQLAARTGVRSTEGRWIDSICYHTMVGECYYHMGDNAQALEQYNSALKLFLAHRQWMLRVQFPDLQPQQNGRAPTITWGASARRTRQAQMPDSFLSMQGQIDNRAALNRGGVITPPSLYPIRAAEIIRCTVLSLSRRRELMGPTCQHDPFTDELVEALSQRSAPANHWCQAWIDVQLGVAYAGQGKTAQAISFLQRSLLLAGEYDHQLTSYALLELGKLAFEQKQHPAAANYFLEASFAAVNDGQGDVLEEAFRYGTVNHLVAGGNGIYPPLLRAPAWSELRNYPVLETSLYVLMAESYSSLGQTVKALAALDEARRSMNRTEQLVADVGSRYHYQLAVAQYQNANIAAGNTSLGAALSFQKAASRRLFQIALADNLYIAGGVSPRVAMDLFANVMREPTPADWVTDTMDTLAVQLTPFPVPMEHWFEAALLRKEPDLALEIADRIRRQRFFATMPMGGRLVALRWILESPKDELPDAAALQRQTLLVKFPGYAELSRQATAVREQLAALPLAPVDETQIKQQKALLGQLSKISGLQELGLREIAVRREPSDLVFPRLRTTEQIREAMLEGQISLYFFSTSRAMYAFLFTKENYAYWQIDSPQAVLKQATSMLREMGMFEKNLPLTTAQLSGTSWKKPARDLLNLLTKNAKPDFWDRYDELVIVPDGILWYVPFEALQVGSDDDSQALISKVRIRYAPTASTITPLGTGRKRIDATMVVKGRLFPGDDDQPAQVAFDSLRRDLPGALAVPAQLNGPSSLLASLWDRLVVLDDIDDAPGGPYDWSPVQVDRGKAGSALAGWLTLPWGRPQQVVLPGYHTSAEDALKRPGTGEEIFLAACGLLASGSDTVLLSRWRTGGRSCFELVHEFLVELPHSSAAAAWQRSVQLLMAGDLDGEREPRAKVALSDAALKTDHPFWWAGYMLIDSGNTPRRADEAAPAPAVEIKAVPAIAP